jgi:phosphopantothenoylcysteine decarboxylase/phosphopantothenate--cysteine ligase
VKILVTGGPTREYVDRLRYLTNPATGLMGDALAREAKARGHEVTLVRGPCPTPAPEEVKSIPVETTEEMRRACLEQWPSHDVVIMSAAPCDYRPSEKHPGKLNKLALGEKIIVSFVRTPDILFEMAVSRKPGQRLVGFAFEVENGEQNAMQKLERKNLDLVVLSPPENFGRESGNTVILFGRAGRMAELRGSKRDLARGVLEALERTTEARTA